MSRPIAILAFLTACGGSTTDDTSPTTDPTPTVPTTVPTGDTGSGFTGPTTAAGTATGTTTPGPQPLDFCDASASSTVVADAVVGPADLATLQDTLDNAAPGSTIAFEDGQYLLTTPLIVRTTGLTLTANTPLTGGVVFDGNFGPDALFEIEASDVTLQHLTLTKPFTDAVRVKPAAADVTNTRLHHVQIIDAPRWGLFLDEVSGFHADGGEVSCSQVQLTATGRAQVRNFCEVGGIEAEAAQGWTVRDTTVEGFWCDLGTAEPGIRFWKGARDTVVDRVLAKDNHRGIALGFTDSAIVRGYDDNPCGGAAAQHYGGMVRNSVAWAYEADLLATFNHVEYGISVERACEVKVLHNTVMTGSDPSGGSIVHRYATTTGDVKNNLVNYTVRRLDGANTSAIPNDENAPDNYFGHVPSIDLHLTAQASTAIDQGSTDFLGDVADDHEGIPRDAAPDIGAFEAY